MAIIEDPEGFEATALRAAVPSFDDLRVLEVGAGSGRLTRHFAGRARSIVAIDPDEDAIADLRLEFPHVDARAVGIEALDLDPHSVDVVIFAWSL
ncbi:MAG TPA: class I SAM-dependent methyltransferase [Vicinamibacterales bacterium]|nr:class I SAM-dependent methyltransferase [Vicinamibacterales bacterium]